LELQQPQQPPIIPRPDPAEETVPLSERDFQDALGRLSSALPIERMTPAQLLRAQQQMAAFLGKMSEQLAKKMTK